MGIGLGFASYMWEQLKAAPGSEWAKRINVVEEASSGKFLVVDGNNLLHHLYADAGLDCIFGGQMAAFEDIVLRWATDLMDAGVELRVVFDGLASPQKQPTLMNRKKQRLDLLDRIAAGCQAADLPQLPFPFGITETAKRAFCSLACAEREKMRPMLRVTFAFEEADPTSAKLGRHPDAIGILTSDSDFLFYEGCMVLPIQYFKPQSAVRLEAAKVAAELGLKLEVYRLIPGLAGNDVHCSESDALRPLHRKLMRQHVRKGSRPPISYRRARLLSILSFLRPKKSANAVFQALHDLLPKMDMIQMVVEAVQGYAAPMEDLEPGLEEAPESWEELSDDPVQPAAGLGHPFHFTGVDLPEEFLNACVERYQNRGDNMYLLWLLEHPGHTTSAVMEALSRSSSGNPRQPSFACVDVKLAVLRRVLYGMVFDRSSQMSMPEVIRVPDGITSLENVQPLYSPAIPCARQLLGEDVETRWQWVKRLLGLHESNLSLNTPAALALAAFYMMSAHYSLSARHAEAFLCGLLCPREEAFSKPNTHTCLNISLLSKPPPASLLQGFTTFEASLPSLHACYHMHVRMLAAVLGIQCPDEMYFDSVVYRHVLSDRSKGSQLPWYTRVQEALALGTNAQDYHDWLGEVLVQDEYKVALDELHDQERRGWQRLKDSQVIMRGTITYVHQQPGEKPFAFVQFQRDPKAPTERKAMLDSGAIRWDKLVSGSGIAFQIHNNRIMPVKL